MRCLSRARAAKLRANKGTAGRVGHRYPEAHNLQLELSPVVYLTMIDHTLTSWYFLTLKWKTYDSEQWGPSLAVGYGILRRS